VLSSKLPIRLKEGESERQSLKLFFGDDTLETLCAFANSRGGVIIIGISDQKEIIGVKNAKSCVERWLTEIHERTAPHLFPKINIVEIEEKSIVCIYVAEYPVKPVSVDGKYFIRKAKINKELSFKEVIEFRQNSTDSHWDSKLRPGKSITDLSFEKIRKQIERISDTKQLPEEETLVFLRKYGLSVGDSVTNACWLMFLSGEAPEATIEIKRFTSPTIISDSLTLKCDLFNQVEETVRFICKYIENEDQTDETKKWKYPVEAIRELVINMIIHRDYTSDENSLIKIFDDYIEFINPGELPEGFTLRQMLSEEYISVARNCQITEIFKDSGMFDDFGGGIKFINKTFVDYGLRPPSFIKLQGRLTVRVYGETADINRSGFVKDEVEEINVVDNSSLQEQNIETAIDDFEIEGDQPGETSMIFSDRVKYILESIKSDNRISLSDISLKLNVSKRTILRDIKVLKEKKILERIGSEKNGYWEVLSDSLP